MDNGIGNSVPNFYNVFSVGHSKPMLIAETSALFKIDGGGAAEADIKKEWLRQVYNIADATIPSVRESFPNLKAICWFSQKKPESRAGGVVDWRLDANPAVLSFYQSIVADPYFLKAPYDFDSVAITASPTVVEPNQTYPVTIQYKANATDTPGAARDIVLGLLDPANNFAWYGGSTTSVMAGTHQRIGFTWQ